MTPRAQPARWRAGAGLLLATLFAAALGTSAIPQLAPAVTRILLAFDHGSENARQALARMSGAEYADAIGAITRQLPPDAPYGLIDAVDVREGGGYWVRHDLAPRRPVYLGSLTAVAADPERARAIVARGEYLVVAHGSPVPPELWAAADLERWLAGRDAR